MPLINQFHANFIYHANTGIKPKFVFTGEL